MQIVVLATALQKEELTNKTPLANILWVEDRQDFLHHINADAFLDLRFTPTAESKAVLSQLLPKPVIVNSVTDTVKEIHPSFVRINGWRTFLSSPLTEASCDNEAIKQSVEEAFASLNKNIHWLPDEPGFVTARVVSMIINEAYLALDEGVSTKDEINTAMKLGTAYPYGPFEWAEKIGVENIVMLLEKLSKSQPRYTPAGLLVREMAKTI